MTRFVIDLGDIDLAPETADRLNGDLQKVALGYLAGMKFKEPLAVRFPWEWKGLIARLNAERLVIAEKQIINGIADVRIGGGR